MYGLVDPLDASGVDISVAWSPFSHLYTCLGASTQTPSQTRQYTLGLCHTPSLRSRVIPPVETTTS